MAQEILHRSSLYDIDEEKGFGISHGNKRQQNRVGQQVNLSFK